MIYKDLRLEMVVVLVEYKHLLYLLVQQPMKQKQKFMMELLLKHLRLLEQEEHILEDQERQVQQELFLVEETHHQVLEQQTQQKNLQEKQQR